LLCGEKFIKTLNKNYRDKDKATDVLTFIYNDNTQNTVVDSFFGEIIICPIYAKKNAKNFNNDYNTEIKRLLIHGVLHLLGYDHELSSIEEEKMFDKQEELLKTLEEIIIC
jgi:probable rRNA maturation factor